ncbi:MAG: hypothetical protein JWN73_4433 [Betaproteobacteria bacterium]|nr:hypothetical protein [Betaproteobacteria bacterium]
MILAAAIGMLAAGAAQAQARVEKNITLPLAMEAAAAAVASRTAGNYAVTATVVDRAGQIRAQLRADNAGPHTNDTSRRKAYMSATMRVNSGTIAENVAKNPGAAGVAQITDFIMLAGGVPIKVGNETIGAIGVGGAPGGNLDEACASAGIDKIKDRLN